MHAEMHGYGCLKCNCSGVLMTATRQPEQIIMRFNKYLRYCQENDLVCNCAQTDVKGSRNSNINAPTSSRTLICLYIS